MQGDKDQADRERSLADFKAGRNRLIIDTETASQTFDIDNITYLIKFDFPSIVEEYVHRIVRTGRFGEIGKWIVLELTTLN